MTKKDYELIAYALSLSKPDLNKTSEMEAWRTIVVELAYALSQDNPRFDAAKFTWTTVTGE